MQSLTRGKKASSLGHIAFGWKSSAVLELAAIPNGCAGDLPALSLWGAHLCRSATTRYNLLKSEELGCLVLKRGVLHRIFPQHQGGEATLMQTAASGMEPHRSEVVPVAAHLDGSGTWKKASAVPCQGGAGDHSESLPAPSWEIMGILKPRSWHLYRVVEEGLCALFLSICL